MKAFKAFCRQLLKTIASIVALALAIALSIALMPHLSKWIDAVLPDKEGTAITESMVISRYMKESERLETSRIVDEGAFESSLEARVLGTVQRVTVSYEYRASLGIDLAKVGIKASGKSITLSLPDVEVLADSITPLGIERHDFLYPLSDERLQTLLEDEKLKCRAHYLEENNIESEQVWANTTQALENLVENWIAISEKDLEVHFEKASDS